MNKTWGARRTALLDARNTHTCESFELMTSPTYLLGATYLLVANGARLPRVWRRDRRLANPLFYFQNILPTIQVFCRQSYMHASNGWKNRSKRGITHTPTCEKINKSFLKAVVCRRSNQTLRHRPRLCTDAMPRMFSHFFYPKYAPRHILVLLASSLPPSPPGGGGGAWRRLASRCSRCWTSTTRG